MRPFDAPPFGANDPERLAIWQMLVLRDTDAYLSGDWEAVRDDFIAEGFYGIDARKRSVPAQWRVAFPDLSQYQREWLRQAGETARTVDKTRARAAFFNAVDLTEIEICGDFALARKKFFGALPNRDGSQESLQWQTLYVCRRHASRWKIASFLGYLPYEGPGAALDDPAGSAPAHFVAATRQHATAGPYTPVVGVHADARIFVISGQAPLDPEGKVIGNDITTQSRATLENCRAQLQAADCDLADVFKATIYLTDLANWQAFNAIYREYLRPPYPARTAIETGLLPGLLVEIEMWAAKR